MKDMFNSFDCSFHAPYRRRNKWLTVLHCTSPYLSISLALFFVWSSAHWYSKKKNDVYFGRTCSEVVDVTAKFERPHCALANGPNTSVSESRNHHHMDRSPGAALQPIGFGVLMRVG